MIDLIQFIKQFAMEFAVGIFAIAVAILLLRAAFKSKAADPRQAKSGPATGEGFMKREKRRVKGMIRYG